MSSQAKNIIKYLITLIIGVALLWYFLKLQKPEDIEQAKNAFITADYFWIGLTILISLFEKAVRAYRWNILMEPLGYKPPVKNTFIALMIGYCANIFAPRMGEVARCGILAQTDKVPLTNSFGTVVTERIIDFVCLLILIGASLTIEYGEIMKLLDRTFGSKIASMGSLVQNSFWPLVIVATIFIAIVAIIYALRNRIKKMALFVKVKELGLGLWQGIISVKNIDRKYEFLLCTVVIWVSYFFMTYLAFFALPSTTHLGVSTALVILVVGGLGMSAPVQAGIGAFHFFVKSTLNEVYLVDEGGALSYAFLVHTSQTLLALVAGLICFFISVNLSKKNKAQINIENANI